MRYNKKNFKMNKKEMIQNAFEILERKNFIK